MRRRNEPIRHARTVALLAATLLLAACASPQDVLYAQGPAARELARLGWIALGAFSIVTVVVWVLLVLVIRRRRGSFDEHAPIDDAEGTRWILVGGLIVPASILSVLFVITMGTLSKFPMQALMDPEPSIRITGQQWWFDAEYLGQDRLGSFMVPTELHIPVGEPVTVELVTRDVIHSFWVPKLHGKVDLVPGMANRIRLQADHPGVYDGQCAEFCGEEHAHMRLRVVADAPADYARWWRRQAADAAQPRTAAQAHGRDVFLAGPCAICHTIRGTAAHGSVGPDLTHVGSRSRIAGGMLPNDTADLAAWIVHAQSLKPGARMPDMDDLTGTELRDLTAYLQSLK